MQRKRNRAQGDDEIGASEGATFDQIGAGEVSLNRRKRRGRGKYQRRLLRLEASSSDDSEFIREDDDDDDSDVEMIAEIEKEKKRLRRLEEFNSIFRAADADREQANSLKKARANERDGTAVEITVERCSQGVWSCSQRACNLPAFWRVAR
jgi:hypothetical protein